MNILSCYVKNCGDKLLRNAEEIKRYQDSITANKEWLRLALIERDELTMSHTLLIKSQESYEANKKRDLDELAGVPINEIP